MLLLPTNALPEGQEWGYEPKLDGYRAVAIESNGKVQLRSKHNKTFNTKFSDIVEALAPMPGETVIDGEIVALENGRPSFNALQNYRSSSVSICYFVFDVLILEGQSVMSAPLSARRELLLEHVLPRLTNPIRHCPELNASLSDVINAARAQGLEGIVAKKLNGIYEPGLRSGAWRKMRLNQAQEFVIGGYTIGSRTLDAVIFGYYDNGKLLYAGRTRNGFTPSLREKIYNQFRGLEIADCPFANLPEARSGRWSEGLTADKMKKCRWLKPVLVGRFEYVEWTPDKHLRHARFVALREDAKPLAVHREPEG
jgi:DNA ligase D-like protein (predicted ligase)